MSYLFKKEIFVFCFLNHFSQAITDHGCSTFPYYKKNKQINELNLNCNDFVIEFFG